MGSDKTSPIALAVDGDALRRLIREVVQEALAQLDQARATVGDRLAYSEAEAAAMLGLNQHQLRDERRSGRIAASQIVGGRIRYRREDLIAYLMAKRTGDAANN